MIAPVAYIDLQPGEQSGFVRCKSAEGATQILNKYGPNETSSDISVTLLSGLLTFTTQQHAQDFVGTGIRAVTSLTVPGGQEFHFPQFLSRLN